MSVILRKRKNANGSTSLRLDIFHNDKRTIETLKNLQLVKATTLIDREHNKRKLKQAEEIAIARAAQLQAVDYSMVADAGKKTIVIAWMQNYVDNYKKKDIRMMQAATDRFANFLKEEKKTGLTFMNLTPIIVQDFMEYLNDKSYGEGAMSYYKRFKKMIKRAYMKNLLVKNPTDNLENILKGKATKKDILTMNEITILAHTPIASPEVRRAFLFCCSTGLRWIDINNLTWSNIKWERKKMDINQSKTDEELLIKLNDMAMKLLNEPGAKEDFVFNLPSHSGANKTLRAWVKRAGIDKKITWHNSRHSYGTNLIFTGTDIVTTSKLLGHTSLKHTNRYVDSNEELKDKAIDKINIDLDEPTKELNDNEIVIDFKSQIIELQKKLEEYQNKELQKSN